MKKTNIISLLCATFIFLISSNATYANEVTDATTQVIQQADSNLASNFCKASLEGLQWIIIKQPWSMIQRGLSWNSLTELQKSDLKYHVVSYGLGLAAIAILYQEYQMYSAKWVKVTDATSPKATITQPKGIISSMLGWIFRK